MDIVAQKKAAKAFAKAWEGRGDEKQDMQSFWRALLQEVYGVEHPEQVIQFEKPLSKGFIDAYLPDTLVLIEQKGIQFSLDDKEPRQGRMVTPYEQARDYVSQLALSEKPRYIITSNFKTIRIYDTNIQPTYNRKTDTWFAPFEEISLSDLPTEYRRLNFLVNVADKKIKKEMELSIKAGELVGLIYDELLKQYADVSAPDTLKSLNQLCVRFVFCFYAEDAGIFGKPSMFHDYLQSHRTDARQALIRLFKTLDTPAPARDPYDDEDLLAFPYVNGGLFANEDVIIPRLTPQIIDLILDKASENFDWSGISPTIFGAVFESTLNPQTRRSGGMHYTSIENIHKVIDPLFLDDLKMELDGILQETVVKTKRRRLEQFQDKLAGLKFLDPAAGSGNFLTESYLSLRKLENQALSALLGEQIAMAGGSVLGSPVKVSIGQFYGIEINDFAVSVARTALWIAESQMLRETEELLYMRIDFLPLKSYPNIREGNALRINWEDVVPKGELSYIMGNPPFVGARNQNIDQKNDVMQTCVDRDNVPVERAGFIDYVGCWYYKAAIYMQNTTIEAAFVSTNSITQGEQVEIIWKNLMFSYNVKINFAYQTFVWDSEAAEKANVHCVIIGFSLIDKMDKYLYTSIGNAQVVSHINAYLLPAPECFIRRLSKPMFEGAPRMSNGNRAYDGNNLVMTKSEKDDLISKEPKSAKYIRQYYMGADLMKSDPRYVLWLVDCPPSELKEMPYVLKRVQAVKGMREKSKNSSTKKAALTPSLFQTICQPINTYIAFPRVSSQRRRYIPIAYLDKDIICGDKLIIVVESNIFLFGLLMSNVHNAWLRVVSGRLKSDIEYSSNVYNNFPWPSPTPAQRAKIEQTAQAILDARALYPSSSLADLYDPLTMPPELLKAHQQNDRAVMEAYGFKGTAAFSSEAACVAELMKLYRQKTAGADA